MEITIKGDDKKLLKQVEDLARELGLKISWRKEMDTIKNGAEISKLMKEIAKKGGIKSIPDPEQWQNEIRTDRQLPGRE